MQNVLLCSLCFFDEGIRLEAMQLGKVTSKKCKNCSRERGSKLDKNALWHLAHRYFVWGSMHRCKYGAAPVIQVNEHHETDIDTASWFERDLRLLEAKIGLGAFYYGPRTWMVGEVEPLKDLQKKATRDKVIERVLKEYPSFTAPTGETFYRVRKGVSSPKDESEYDSAPINFAGKGRLDSKNFPVMYGSQDLEVCVHERRLTVEDEVYFATLELKKELKFLDLTIVFEEAEITEFESLDMAVHMLFLAGKHSYKISREIALAASKAGFDGLVYPSFFSLLRTGAMPFETSFGLSHRRFKELANQERMKIIPNLAIFGRPIEDGRLSIKSINRLLLKRADYTLGYGPVGY